MSVVIDCRFKNLVAVLKRLGSNDVEQNSDVVPFENDT
jgi:hypothetical protein